jgi:hypothetical protein
LKSETAGGRNRAGKVDNQTDTTAMSNFTFAELIPLTMLPDDARRIDNGTVLARCSARVRISENEIEREMEHFREFF